MIGAVFWLLGQHERAVVLWGIAAIVLVLVVAGVPVERYVARAAAAAARGVSLGTSLGVGVVLVAVGGLLRLLRRDPLTPRGFAKPGWHPATSAPVSDRLATATFGMERAVGVGPETTGGVGRAAARRFTLAVGSVALLMLLDVTAGMAWDRFSEGDTPLAHVADAINLTGRTDTIYDSRADLPAMAAYPWADEYLREIQVVPGSYWPFTETRPRDFDGEFVNIRDWARASYTAADTPEDAPVVWMFGGSTTWGEGQRDGYTIASYLARIAEREGVPIVVKNYGQRGWTHFQEMVLFEQLLAEGPVPDLALFYDGANEINAQTLGAKGVPTHTLVDQYAEKITGGIAPEFVEAPPPPPSAMSVAWDAYVRQSALFQLGRALRGAIDAPAGAAEATSAQSGGDGEEPDAGRGQFFEKTEEDARRAVDVYERGRAITTDLAESYGVPPVFFWQPVIPGEAEHWANDNMSPPTINISDALDEHRGVYIDGGHTNEEGARLVAERIWAEIGDRIEELHAGPGRSQPRSTATTTTTAAPVSNADAIAAVAAERPDVGQDPCRLEGWLPRLSDLRASSPSHVTQIVDVARGFLTQLAATAPPERGAEAAIVRSMAEQLPTWAAQTELDGDRSFLSQVSQIGADSPFSNAVQALIEPLTQSCG